MTRLRTSLALVLILVALTGMGACATGTPTTPVGKAVQIADVQKQLVEAAAVEFMKAHLCTEHVAPAPPKCQGLPALTDATYQKGRAAYQKWAASHTAVSRAIATVKGVQSAENEQKLQTAMQQVTADMNAYLNVVGAFVDVPALQKKVGG